MAPKIVNFFCFQRLIHLLYVSKEFAEIFTAEPGRTKAVNKFDSESQNQGQNRFRTLVDEGKTWNQAEVEAFEDTRRSCWFRRSCNVFDPEIADSYSNQEALDVLNFDHENHIRKSKGGQEENFKEMLVHSITRVSSKSWRIQRVY